MASGAAIESGVTGRCPRAQRPPGVVGTLSIRGGDQLRITMSKCWAGLSSALLTHSHPLGASRQKRPGLHLWTLMMTMDSLVSKTQAQGPHTSQQVPHGTPHRRDPPRRRWRCLELRTCESLGQSSGTAHVHLCQDWQSGAGAGHSCRARVGSSSAGLSTHSARDVLALAVPGPHCPPSRVTPVPSRPGPACSEPRTQVPPPASQA